MPIDLHSRAILQVRRPNNGPIQCALFYDSFLAFMVRKSMSQEYAHDDVLGKERQVGAAISHAKRGLTDQALHASTLHNLNDVSCCLFSKSCAGRARPNGYEYGIVPCHGAFYSNRIQHVATNNFQTRMLYVLYPGRITDKCRNAVTLVESLVY